MPEAGAPGKFSALNFFRALPGRLQSSPSAMQEVVQYLRDLAQYARDVWEADWLPVSRPALAGWSLFFAWFLWHAARGEPGGLFLDPANLVIHEAGHPLFSYLGDFMGAAGGTILQLLVPLLLAMAFHVRRQPIGFALFLFIVFENFLYVAKYMADARAMALDYVAIGVGATSGEEMDPMSHDWHNIFSHLGVLAHDTRIGAFTNFLGWVGMLGTTAWFLYRGARDWQQER